MSQIADYPESAGWANNTLFSAQDDGFRPGAPARWLAIVRGDLASSFDRSNFLKPLRDVQDLLRKMWGIEKNWESHGAEPPNFVSIQAAGEFAQWAITGGLTPDRIEPSAEGGVAVAFFRGDKRAIAEFLNDGARDLLLYEISGEMSNSSSVDDSPLAILTAIRDYLSASTEAGC
jgi:hypothetical protein